MLVLIGVLLVIVGFAVRLNPLIVVTVSGIVTALLGGTVDVAIVVEDDAAMASAWSSATRLRAAGLSVELIASGSPRKRYDRAVKRGAGEIVVLGFADGAVTRRVKAGEPSRAEAILAGQ